MSRPSSPDPTLAGSPSDADLVARVQSNQDSDAITAIINKHSGIYFSIAKNYAAAYPGIIKMDVMSDDKMYNIYEFVLDYKPDRGMKLGTYIGTRTDYLCKTLLKKDERNPLGGGNTCSTSGSAIVLDEVEGAFRTADGGKAVVLKDETTSSRIQEVANRDIGMDDILKVASSRKVCRDKRFVDILRHRAASLSWREIGEKMGMSHERARVIYQENLVKVKNKLMKTTI